MSLMSSLSNASSGMRINQDSLDILSRNVRNAGTPGYHRQSLNVVDYNEQFGSYARSHGIRRAFNATLQAYYNRQVTDTAQSGVRADYLNQLQTYLGKPGAAGSLDTMFGALKNAWQSLATSTDDYNARTAVINEAQAMAQRLNQLSGITQGLRQDAESRIGMNVNNLNSMLVSLQEVNARMLDIGSGDEATRAALADQRDRLVAGLGEMLDIKASYQSNGTVTLMTGSGIGLLDGSGVSQFSFSAAGALAPTSQGAAVGQLTMTTPAGLVIDPIRQGVLQGGELAGLVELRDKTLVEFQDQLDQIAAGLARVFSTQTTEGTPSTLSGSNGFKVDLTGMKPGDDLLLTYTRNGVEQRVRIVNSTSGEDYLDASGQRYIAIDLTDPAVAANLALKLPDLTIHSPAPGELQIVDDGSSTTDVTGLTTRKTVADGQSGDMGFPLFVDNGAVFTDNPDSNPPQKLGFAARIAINPAVLQDNRLVVQYNGGTELGDARRPEYIIDQLNKMRFVSDGDPKADPGKFRLNGRLGDIVGQVLGFQGQSISGALSHNADNKLMLDTIATHMQGEYGVDVDQEMARLIDLQNAYAANARVMSVVQELLDTLFAAT